MGSLMVEVPALANVHTHLREGNVTPYLVEKATEGGADVLLPMPNTVNGLKTAPEVASYIADLQSYVPHGKVVHFLPIALLNERTSFKMIDEWAREGIADCKVYPRCRTTNSDNGVRRYGGLLSTIQHCARSGIKCHFHPEYPLMSIGNRDAELAFLAILDMALNETDAIIVSEHGTDARCIPAWLEMAKSGRFFVTLTAHHLVENEDGSFGDTRSVCKPPIKSEVDRRAMIELVADGWDWLMAGLDDAAHDRSKKHVHEGQCACGAYTAPFGLALYAHALSPLLETSTGLGVFYRFVSFNARKLHGLPLPTHFVKLKKEPFQIPLSYQLGPWEVEPFWAGRTIDWTLVQ